MNFDFLKAPSTIAALLLVLIYFLPMTPYFTSTSGKDDSKRTHTITGLGMLTGSVKIEGKDVQEDSEQKRAKHDYFAKNDEFLNSDDEKAEYKPMFGILDKLAILLALGAGLLVFVAYQKGGNQTPILDEDKMGWVKTIVIGLGLIVLSRYCFNTGVTTNAGAGLGAWISLLAVVFIAMEARIMKLMGK